MRKIIYIFAVLLVAKGALFAQNPTVSRIEKRTKEDRTVNSEIIGDIDSVVYVATSRWLLSNDLRISMYDKKTSVLIKSVGTKKYHRKSNDLVLVNAKFNQAIVKNNNIYIVWIVENARESRLMIQIYDNELNEIQKPIVMYQLLNKKKSVSTAHPFFVISPDGSKMIVGGEENAEKGNNVKLQYKIMNSRLEVQNTIQVELPYSVTSNIGNTSANYMMDDQGVLYFSTAVIRKEGGMIIPAQLIGNVKPETSELVMKYLYYGDKHISNIEYEISGDELLATGVYNTKYDARKPLDLNQEYEQGVMTMTMDKNTLEMKGDPAFSLLKLEKIVSADFEMGDKEKKKYSKEEFVLSKINKQPLMIMQSYKTSDNGRLLVLNQQHYLRYCNGDFCNIETVLTAICFVNLDENGRVLWISCADQHMTTHKEEIKFKNRMGKIKEGYCYILQQEKKNICYLINEKMGLVNKSVIPKLYFKENIALVDNQIYYVGLKYNRLSKVAKIGIGVSGAAAIATLFFFPYVSPAGVIIGGVFTVGRGSNVYFGRYEINNVL